MIGNTSPSATKSFITQIEFQPVSVCKCFSLKCTVIITLTFPNGFSMHVNEVNHIEIAVIKY
jgi:hypothetical protein